MGNLFASCYLCKSVTCGFSKNGTPGKVGQIIDFMINCLKNKSGDKTNVIISKKCQKAIVLICLMLLQWALSRCSFKYKLNKNNEKNKKRTI